MPSDCVEAMKPSYKMGDRGMKAKLALVLLLSGLSACQTGQVDTTAANEDATGTQEEQDAKILRDMGLPPSVILDMVRSELARRSEVVEEQETDVVADVGQLPSTAPEETAVQSAPQAVAQQVVQTVQQPPTYEQPAREEAPVAPTLVVQAQSQPLVFVAPGPTDVHNVDVFYEPLSSYGRWLYLGQYGKVWQPMITVTMSDWQPYCHGGRWEWRDDHGWSWHSDYAWGWAPFHYGRWVLTASHRWVWVPDTEWGPAWVHWRRTDTYCGWAPLPPGTGYRVGFGFVYNGDRVGLDAHLGLSYTHYTFVERSKFLSRDLAPVRLPQSRNRATYSDSVTIQQAYGDSKDGHIMNVGPSRNVTVNAGKRTDRVRSVIQRQSSAPSVSRVGGASSAASVVPQAVVQPRPVVVAAAPAPAPRAVAQNTRTTARTRVNLVSSGRIGRTLTVLQQKERTPVVSQPASVRAQALEAPTSQGSVPRSVHRATTAAQAVSQPATQEASRTDGSSETSAGTSRASGGTTTTSSSSGSSRSSRVRQVLQRQGR